MTMQELYRHEAVPYEGQDDFVSCGAAMVEDAGSHNEWVLFLLSGAKTDALRQAIGDRFPVVSYVDMDEHGRNPSRLLSMLEAFLSRSEGRPCVGVNEPVMAGVSAAAIAEAQLGETLLNAPALQSWQMSVRCLYDSARLDADSTLEMYRTHPTVRGLEANADYDPDLVASRFAAALPPAPEAAVSHEVAGLGPARQFVRDAAAALPDERREDLVLAANEVVTNSLQHGGGTCRMSIWHDNGTVVCEVRDAGQMSDPLLGRLAPAQDARAGRGLWLANHLCDLVQVRSSQDGTTVRLYVDH